MSPEILQFLALLGGIATLISIIGVFIKVGGIKQEIIEVRKDTEELKFDLKTHGNNLQAVREDVASMKGARVITNPHPHPSLTRIVSSGE